MGIETNIVGEGCITMVIIIIVIFVIYKLLCRKKKRGKIIGGVSPEKRNFIIGYLLGQNK